MIVSTRQDKLYHSYDTIPQNIWPQGLIPGKSQNTPHPLPSPTRTLIFFMKHPILPIVFAVLAGFPAINYIFHHPNDSSQNTITKYRDVFRRQLSYGIGFHLRSFSASMTVEISIFESESSET